MIVHSRFKPCFAAIWHNVAFVHLTDKGKHNLMQLYSYFWSYYGCLSVCYSVSQIPGLLKIRYIGQTTVGSAAIFGLFLGAGSLIHCGKSY